MAGISKPALLVGRSDILSDPVNRENRVYFTAQPSRHYEVDYIKNCDGYSFKLYDVSKGRPQ